jgi:hypothetical protein
MNQAADIRELAERGLRGNPYPVLKNISCEVRDGVLVLRGCLPSYYLKQVAQAVLAHLAGVARIDNQIQVVSRPSGPPGLTGESVPQDRDPG